MVWFWIGYGLLVLAIPFSWTSLTALAAFAFFVLCLQKRNENRISRLLAHARNLEEAAPEKDDALGRMEAAVGTLVGEVKHSRMKEYESLLKQREFELKALRHQINPHFLYNTLSMINFKALAAGEKDISNITLALSNFYRTSLNKGKNTCTIREELANVKSYLDIQSYMHDDSFDMQIDCPESLMDHEVLNLILQPLAENAVCHGLDGMEGRKGSLHIRVWEEAGQIFMEVEDNGAGMDDAAVNAIFETQTKGYGMRNVHERLVMTYGPEYGLFVESGPGQGTRVTVRFPFETN